MGPLSLVKSTLLSCVAAHLAAAETGVPVLDWILSDGSDTPPTLRGAVETSSATLEEYGDAAKPKWDALKSLLQGWEFTQNYALAVGTPAGRVFLYEGGNFTMKTLIPTGSTSKWPSAMMFAGLVNDGHVKSFDDPVHKYLPWWTKDPKDLRSTVTFRMLLDFTSGFGDGAPGEEENSRAAREWRKANNVERTGSDLKSRLEAEIGVEAAKPCDTNTGDVLACGKSIYSGVKLIGNPGEVYSYNSNHLQLAATVAVTVTGLDIQAVIKKYLLEPFNMTHSFYSGKCPDFGATLMTTGEDYENFISHLLAYRGLSKAVIEESEKDGTPFMSDQYTLYGNYGFGHFLMCFDSLYGMTDKCRSAKCHMDPGAFGFIPIIDRKYNYYVELVAAEIGTTGSYPLSGIPEYLAVAIKPYIDAIMSKEELIPFEFNTHSPRFLSMSVADVNYCLNCVLHPDQCS
mmetsp:Transcript_44094/g.104336  ORF Transcript_44094/g.104336 Transcript_44094/m.104336 type:complete len:457 (-) Transcript_44094:190-1560(-)